MKKAAFSLWTVILVAFLLPGVSVSAPKHGGTLVFGVAGDAKQLDPHKASTTPEARPLSLVCQGLVVEDRQNDPKPALAESWETSPDGLAWTFHLRKGVRFHNGREMKAKDITFNFNRIMDPNTKASHGKDLTALVAAVEMVDDYTVRFKLKRASTSFLGNFYGVGCKTNIIAPECVKADGMVDLPIGTGPFQFAEWKPNEHMTFKKFDQYWEKGLPYLDEVIIKIVPDETVRLTALQTGQLDMASAFSLGEAARLVKKNPKDYRISMEARGTTLMLHFNVSQPPFNDPRVRRAVAHAIDRDEINLGSLDGTGEPVAHGFPSQSIWYEDAKGLGRDIQKAKDLLKEAGYPNGLDVNLVTTNTFATYLRAAEVVQAQLKEIGINANLEISDWPTLVKKTVKGLFAIGLAGWAIRPEPGVCYPALFAPNGRYSFLVGRAYDNPKLNELFLKGDQEVSYEKRRGIYREAVEEIIKDVPWIFLVSQPSCDGWRADVVGFRPQLVGNYAYIGGGLQHTWLER